jgi:hypothetical protein
MKEYNLTGNIKSLVFWLVKKPKHETVIQWFKSSAKITHKRVVQCIVRVEGK